MQDKTILAKIKGRDYYLNNITANRIAKEPDDRTANIMQEADFSILENTADSLVIKVNTKAFVEPEALFLIETEHIIEFELKEKVSSEDVEKNINELIPSLGHEISYLIASLTKKMIGIHVILPPGLEIESDK